MIKYIGSKRVLVPLITEVVGSIPGVASVADLFSGTARVARALKATGHDVTANDHNAYAHCLARAYVQTDEREVSASAERLLRELSALAPKPGYFTETFCERSRYVHPANGARIDAIRERIAELVRGGQLDADLEAVLLTSLMEAADRVDSTTGVQMAYLKQWAPRALNDLELRMPALLPRGGRALQLDALQAARVAKADLAYLDPPYNQHSYLGNYHVWETLVRWDKPPVYGVACKRADCRDYESAFNSRPRAFCALQDVVSAVLANGTRHLVISFSDEGFIPPDDMEAFLSSVGHLATIEVDSKRYVGAQIGIYNPQGEKVGRPGRLRNTEHLYVVSQDASVADEVRTRFA